jgi:hypothetical protein
MLDLNAPRSLLAPHDLTFLAGAPYVYHCHHYNLFHDQTVDDILGEDAGLALRIRAAASAFHDLLSSLTHQSGLRTPAECVQLGQTLVAAMGHGRLSIDASESGGNASGGYLHYGYTWAEKYGSRIRRHTPADAVVGGFAAAINEVAFGLPKGSIKAVESACVAKRDASCEFRLERTQTPALTKIDESMFARILGDDSDGGLYEARIAAIATTLQQFMRGVGGDQRGLVEAFGVFVTMHLSNYYNETAYEAIRLTEARTPALLSTAEDLFKEAGHVCVFNTFSNILLSPEWEGVAGPLEEDPLAIVLGCLSIARGLGFGRWSLQDYVPGKQLTISSTSNYEAPFWLARYGPSDRPRSYVFLGAALAIMVVASRMQLWKHPVLDAETYARLFKGDGLGFSASLTECQATGSARTVAVVTAA